VGLGFSGKDQGVHASLSLVYRWDAWKGMEWTGDRSARIDLGPEGDVQEVAPLEGRPVSPVPLRRMRFSVTPATLSPDQDGLNDAATLRVEGFAGGSLRALGDRPEPRGRDRTFPTLLGGRPSAQHLGLGRDRRGRTHRARRSL
jgi:hypothetical protein